MQRQAILPNPDPNLRKFMNSCFVRVATRDGVPPTALSLATAAVKAFVSRAEAPVFVTVDGVASNPVSFWVEQ